MSKSYFKKLKQNRFANTSLCGLCAFAGKTCIKNFAFVCLLFSVFLSANCKTENAELQNNKLTREIADDSNRRVRLSEKIERAVSLAPNLTEIAFAVDAGDKLVGVTSYCNYPAEAAKIQKIGDTLNPNIENIIALRPQVVLVSTASQMETFSKTLEQQGITIFVTNPNRLEDIYKSIYQIGEIFGRNDKAREVVDGLKMRVAKIEAKTNNTKDVKVFVQIDKNSLYTIGKDSFITDLITRAGGVSLTANVSTAYPNISRETAFALNPDAIILTDSPDNNEPNEVFRNSPAVKNGKVFKINADILSRPAPRIVDALEQIAQALHPENFN